MSFDYQYSSFVSPTPQTSFTRSLVTVGGTIHSSLGPARNAPVTDFIAEGDSASAACHDRHGPKEGRTMRSAVIGSTLIVGYLLAQGSSALAKIGGHAVARAEASLSRVSLRGLGAGLLSRELPRRRRLHRRQRRRRVSGGSPAFTDDYCWHAAHDITRRER